MKCVVDFPYFDRNVMVTRVMRTRLAGVILIYLQFFTYVRYDFSSTPDRTYICKYDTCLSEASIYYMRTHIVA